MLIEVYPLLDSIGSDAAVIGSDAAICITVLTVATNIRVSLTTAG